MPEEKYVVLQTESLVVPTIENLGTRPSAIATTAEPVAIRVEEAALTGAERNDLRRDPRTRALAPIMPMKLIEPVEQQDVDAVPAPTPAAPTWGVKAVRAPESSFDGRGVTIAVLDTGIDPNHPAFVGVNLVQKNFTTEAENDEVGHGTHCAGTIFGQDVNGTRIGIARKVDRALIGKVLGQEGGSSSIIAQGIQWAANEGANVISMSLGIDFPGYVEFLVKQGLNINPATSIALEGYRANINLFTELARFVQANSVFGQGTVIVAASGNESNRPQYEIAVAPPAAGSGVVAIGALQEGTGGFSVASFSNNQVNISAPGVNVISAKLGGGLVSFSGTSMATPHAAGVAALWAQRQFDRTGRINGQLLMAQLIASGTTTPLVADAEAEDVGAGIVQCPLN